MNFRVFVVIESPIIDKRYELFVPIDRRIHELLTILKNSEPEFSKGYYENHELKLYNKTTGNLYDMNLIIKDSDIKMGTRLVIV